MQSPETRASQHLLVQGFTIYPCAAAACSRLVARSVLDDPGHAWAVLFDASAQRWAAILDPSDPLHAVFAEAALLATAAPQVVCHAAGGFLTQPLTPTDVRDARMRIEAAVALGKAPAAERPEAFPDELIEREARRRAKRRERQDSGVNAEQASPEHTNERDASSMRPGAPSAISPVSE